MSDRTGQADRTRFQIVEHDRNPEEFILLACSVGVLLFAGWDYLVAPERLFSLFAMSVAALMAVVASLRMLMRSIAVSETHVRVGSFWATQLVAWAEVKEFRVIQHDDGRGYERVVAVTTETGTSEIPWLKQALGRTDTRAEDRPLRSWRFDLDSIVLDLNRRISRAGEPAS